MLLAERMRDLGVRVVVHPGSASIKSQMKKADASGAEFVVFAAEDEVAEGVVAIKALREHEGAAYREQARESIAEAPEKIAAALKALRG